MTRNKMLVIGIQLAISASAIGSAHAATDLIGSSLNGGSFTFVSGVNLTNSELKFNAPSNGTYGAMNVSGGDFAGSGSKILMNTVFDAGGTTVAGQGTNRILINGNATGQTTLVVTNSGGAGASTDLNGNALNDANEGISLAQVSGNSAANVFSLQGDYVAVGPYQYRLFAYEPGKSDATQRLVDADADGHWDYRLQNAKAATVVPPAVTPPAAPGKPSAPSAPVTRPGLVPQAPSYLVNNNALFAYGQQMIGALHQRLGEFGGAHAQGDGSVDLYARFFGGDHHYSSNLNTAQYGYDYDQDLHGLQIGGDWALDDGLRLGVALSSGTARTEPGSIYGEAPNIKNDKRIPLEVSHTRTHADSAAITATWLSGGLYVDGVVGGSRYRSDVRTPYRSGNVARLESNDMFASVEAGYGWNVSDLVTIEPQAQLSWQKLDTDSVRDADGVVVDLGSPENFVWRVGARVLFNPVKEAKTALTHYLKINYYDSTGPDQRAYLSGNRFVTGEYGHTAEVGYGMTASLTSHVSVHGDAAWQEDIGHASRDGWGANFGLRWAF